MVVSSVLNAGDPADPRDMFRGWTPAPLSDFGRKTVAQTAQWFKDSKIPIDQIISSDMPRASETAQMISQAVGGAPVQTDPRLRPWHIGNLTGKVITPELKDQMNEYQVKRQDEPIPGGEPYNGYLQRYAGALPEILQAAQTKNIVMVAHHRNALALPTLLFGKPTQTQGPPDPGGVMAVTSNGLRQIFTPPAAAVAAEKASS